MLDFNMELIEKGGGVLMYPILFLSVLSLAIFLERMVTLSAARYVPSAFKDKLKKKLSTIRI